MTGLLPGPLFVAALAVFLRRTNDPSHPNGMRHCRFWVGPRMRNRTRRCGRRSRRLRRV